jgi:hypothetical protein
MNLEFQENLKFGNIIFFNKVKKQTYKLINLIYKIYKFIAL